MLLRGFMDRWPRSLGVEVRSTDGSRVERLLVGLRVRHNLRTYYSTLLGLTDAQGRLHVTGDQLAADYAENQGLFPMDYRLPAEEWDTSAIIDLAGGDAFEQSRAAALSAPLVHERFREMWRDARNTGIASQETVVSLHGDEATAVLTARRIGPP